MIEAPKKKPHYVTIVVTEGGLLVFMYLPFGKEGERSEPCGCPQASILSTVGTEYEYDTSLSDVR